MLARKAEASRKDCRQRRAQEIERLALALAGHDPQRTLERGYVLVHDGDGRPVACAAQVRDGEQVDLRFADATLPARIARA